MNKIIKKIGAAVLTASMLLSMFAVAACNNGDGGNSNDDNNNDVHTHSLTKVDGVPAGCLEDGEEDSSKNGNIEYYTCECGKWFKDEAATQEISDHSAVVIKATGHDWDGGVISDDNTTKTETCRKCNKKVVTTVSSSFTITYYYNYEGAPEAKAVKYEGGVPAFAPEAPVNPDTDYVFGGWYLESKCETLYDFTENLTEDIELYAKWKQETLYVFEAEYTKVRTLKGVGWSNNANGLDMIMRDTNGSVGNAGVSGASNGFYVGYLYKNGITLTFEINSAEAVTDATLTLRVSGEMTESIILTGDEYLVKVNGTKVDYPGISITGIDPKPDAEKHAFQDFLVTASLNLVEGKNTITLTTNNGKKLGGTATATAPLVDCIKIRSSSELTWSPVESNLKDWD